MDIQQLKYFVAIAEHKSYTKAAEQLYVTQPILTRCIKGLEAELGACLIERSNRTFRLTDVGQILYKQSLEILSQYQDVFRSIEDVKSTRVGAVRISSPGVLLDMYFPPLLTNFRQKNPGIDVSIVEEGSKPAMLSVLNGEADIGLVMLPIDNMYEFDVIPVIEDEVRLMTRVDHPIANRKSAHIDELRYAEIITYSDTSTLHDEFIRICQAHGFNPRIVYKSLLPMFCLEMISRGPYIGVFPAPMIRRYMTPEVTSVHLEPQFNWTIAMILKKGRYQTFASKKLVAYIQEYFKQISNQM